MQPSRRFFYALIHFIAEVDSQRRRGIKAKISPAQYSIEGSSINIRTGRYNRSDNDAESKKPHETKHYILAKKRREV